MRETTLVSYDRKAAVVAGLIRQHCGRAPKRILVVGCGTGREAAQLAQSLGSDVTGIDIAPRFDAAAAKAARLQWGDATALEFPDAAFDFVYSYHALEHIPDYRAALAQMKRVLAKDGHFWLGTPNRHRLIGYVGGSNTVFPMRDKIAFNYRDWSLRLRGKFRNEHGAHAGFARSELAKVLTDGLGPVKDMTIAYYTTLYPHRQTFVRSLEATQLSKVFLPSVYFIGRRTSG
jgi:ubiquinone/menaquinone biosynthesis C-methylase UbiE